jgi:RNA exonuclease 1
MQCYSPRPVCGAPSNCAISHCNGAWTHLFTISQNSRSIQKVVTLLIPGLTPSLLALPPLPTSATANPNVPLSIPLPDVSSTDIPFIASTFSHACPTRAPGEPTRMHSVLSAFFHGPVSGEEKRKRIQQRLKCKSFLCSEVSR